MPYVPLSHPFVERLIGTFVVPNKSAGVAISYVALVQIMRQLVLLAGLERHITGTATKRDRTPGMPGPHLVLDHDRPGREGARFPTLL